MFNATNPPGPSRHNKRSRRGPSISHWFLRRRVLAAVLAAAALAVTFIFPGRHEGRRSIWVVEAFPTSFLHSAIHSRRHFSLFSTTQDADKEIADDHVKNEKGMRIAIVGSGAVGS